VAVRIALQFACRERSTPTAAEIRSWIKTTLRGLRKDAELTVRIVDMKEGSKLNRRWRRRAGPTNVLAFPSQGVPDLAPAFMGDIVICAPVVKREAAQQRKELIAHWAHVVVHGVLHLLGFEHDRKKPAAAMEAMEIRILKKLGFNNPYIRE
jgi:probable rRNA maturation factor